LPIAAPVLYRFGRRGPARARLSRLASSVRAAGPGPASSRVQRSTRRANGRPPPPRGPAQGGERRSEAHVPAQQPTPGQAPRVPSPHVHTGRAGRVEGPSSEGPPPAVGL